jgi:hypothetical protein
MEPDEQAHREQQARLQRIVTDVTARMKGRSVPEAMDDLLSAAVTSGLEPPSEIWSRNVATSALDGHAYLVSRAVADDAGLRHNPGSDPDRARWNR